MTAHHQSRRDFIKTAALGAAGFALAPAAVSYARIQGANDRVRVGIVGFSDRARQALIPAFMAHAKELNFDFVAVSDIWSRRRDEGADFMGKLTGHAIEKARNNEELYARKDVDAVMISTADFQHALHGVEAVRAGRDAYIEKPLANTMEDARAILNAVEGMKQIVQIGTQRRSGANYVNADGFIKSGKFGDISMVEMSWNVNQPGRWRRPKLVSEIRKEDTDWDRYLLNRREDGKKPEWDARKYLEYRLFWPYSSGIPDQWMVHQIDTVHWFTGLPRPRSVVANGGIYQWPDGRKNFDTMTAVFDYGPLGDASKGFQVVYSSRMGNSAGGTKELYYSNAGMLNLDTNKISPEGGLR
ncbi:MAG: Gfo/Idh/MocA family oxidoreductase, partial [Rubrivivax sp.]|nr:Gfo/Idh/MocA family oxidoreductase [Pyrinomonadaceae bacterium]